MTRIGIIGTIGEPIRQIVHEIHAMGAEAEHVIMVVNMEGSPQIVDTIQTSLEDTVGLLASLDKPKFHEPEPFIIRSLERDYVQGYYPPKVKGHVRPYKYHP
jgi:hypothetical protein